MDTVECLGADQKGRMRFRFYTQSHGTYEMTFMYIRDYRGELLSSSALLEQSKWWRDKCQEIYANHHMDTRSI